MSNMRDGPVLKAVADVVKQHVGAAFAGLRGKIDAIEAQIKSIPQPEKGEKGDKGDPGEPGPIGSVGPAGKDGIGTVGESGPPGLVGKDGKDGAPGRDGKDGAPGNPGEKGIDGATGGDGKDGEPGAKGLDGVNGKDGKDGISIKGDPGIDGKDGASVDLDAVRILVAGEVNKAVSTLPKPEPGRDGRPGTAGTPGLNGKDAADIDPIDGIDESSAYQRGTWALHRGGMIYAYRTTDPIEGGNLQSAGWRIVFDGIADIVKSLSPDERTEITTHMMTSGKSYTTETEIPNIIYRGTYKEGEHQRGDAVTQAGSLWIANVRTYDRPGISKAWTLAVKRGSDGRDLNGARQ